MAAGRAGPCAGPALPCVMDHVDHSLIRARGMLVLRAVKRFSFRPQLSRQARVYPPSTNPVNPAKTLTKAPLHHQTCAPTTISGITGVAIPAPVQPSLTCFHWGQLSGRKPQCKRAPAPRRGRQEATALALLHRLSLA